MFSIRQVQKRCFCTAGRLGKMFTGPSKAGLGALLPAIQVTACQILSASEPEIRTTQSWISGFRVFLHFDRAALCQKRRFVSRSSCPNARGKPQKVTVPEARNLRSPCLQGEVPSEGSGEGSVPEGLALPGAFPSSLSSPLQGKGTVAQKPTHNFSRALVMCICRRRPLRTGPQSIGPLWAAPYLNSPVLARLTQVLL